MNKKKATTRAPLQGSQVVSAIATGGGGGVFQARIGALYLANMLTGLPTTFGLHGPRVETLRFEARYTGAHTDDIYCQLRGKEGSWLQLIQCKRGLDATPGNSEFVDGLRGAWRDFLGAEGSPFDRASDVLVLATLSPGTPANRAAKRLCELSRSSLDLTDFVQKIESKLFDAQHKRTWDTFKAVSKDTLAQKYTDELLFDLLRRLRVDIHDLGVEGTQELALVQALLTSGQHGDSGEQVWNGLFSYVFEQGITVGTVTRDTWKSTAQAGIQDAVSRISGQKSLGSTAECLNERANLQLSLISTTLPNGKHIPRAQSVAQILAAFDERQLVIVAGGPGVGKSAVIAELAPVLRESGPLIFFRADELDEPSLASVQSLSSMPDAVLGMSRLLSSGTPIVVIDSLEKALEARSPGALEELLALVRQNKGVRVCVTTRSYALNALYSLFLYNFPYKVVDVPLLSDAELLAAVTGSIIETIVGSDDGVREVLRAPYYLRLAFNYTAAGATLPDAAGDDLRLRLWTERVAPNKGLPVGMASRRRSTFDEVCDKRTQSFAQFVDAPIDAEAVDSLVRDAVLVRDSADRVAPAHDVLEDWALFFRVERQVRSAERDWGTLFGKLGAHAGMRRALRTWTAQRATDGDADAYALLEAALGPRPNIPQLWRDEVAIGLLRSERVEHLVDKLGSSVRFDSASLLQRLGHLLRVACKGPTSIDYSGMAEDPGNKEIMLRIGMAAPVGNAWDVVLELVAKALPNMPPECNSWVVQLAEDATSHDQIWYEPSNRVRNAFSIAEHFCLRDRESWYGEQSIGKRFYALLCRCAGADPIRFTAFIDSLLQKLAVAAHGNDSYAEQRLEFMVNIQRSREVSYFTPALVRKVFWALYVDSQSRPDRSFGISGWEAELGLSDRAAHEFFPPSVLQGPFRSLLAYALPESLRLAIDLCNHAAVSLAKNSPSDVSIVRPEQSPNGRSHIHDFRLWAAYRGHSVTSYLLNALLMAVEERLLIEAKAQREGISQVLESILDLGESSLTTGMVAGLMTAHPELVTEKLLYIFRCPQFFSDDLARSVEEPTSLAIHGGNDGFDDARQRERIASNRLPHRRKHLESLVLELQLTRSDLHEAIYRILDGHLDELKDHECVPDGWRMALKRMDARGLKLGQPVDESKWVPLEIANLEPELQRASDDAQAGLLRMNRIGALRAWAGAVTGTYSAGEAGAAERFLSPYEPYEEFLRLRDEVGDDEAIMLDALDDELPCALIHKWPTDTADPLQWARSLVLNRAAATEEGDAWLRRGAFMGELRARTVILLAAADPQLPHMVEALVNIVTEPTWKLRRAAAKSISTELRPKQPVVAEILTTALAHYAEELDTTIKRPPGLNRDLVIVARTATAKALTEAMREMKPGSRSVPKSLSAVKEWTIALDAARSEVSDNWRVRSLDALARLVADQECGVKVKRHDPAHIDFEARWELGDLLAHELLSQPDESSLLFQTLDYCLEKAPELSERILESVLSECLNLELVNAVAFWRVWDRAISKVFDHESLRTTSRRTFSRFDKVLKTILLCTKPWPKTWYDLSLLKSRPHFIAACLVDIGDSRSGLESLLQLMASIGRASAIPSALLQLRDALGRAPIDIFDNGNSLWYAETVCRVTVHEHRNELIQDIHLRSATLDILDRLVDAGSSIGFQLRDYLATSPSAVDAY